MIQQVVLTDVQFFVVFYFAGGFWLAFLVLICIAIHRKGVELPDGMSDQLDALEDFMELRGWTPIVFALIIMVLWLPLLSGRLRL